MISVAMTTYNGELYIEKQIASLLNQTRKPDEVIIVDDCSSDNTVKIIEEFIKKKELKNWKLNKSVSNNGFIRAFYKAIMETTGDLIFLCDHDDVWLPSKIELMSNLMLENNSILSLNSGFNKIDKFDKPLKSTKNLLSSNNNLIRKRLKPGACMKISLEDVVTYNISPGCTTAFRSSIKSVLSNLNEKECNLVHDWKINIIAAAMNGLYFFNVPTINYRLHSSNAIGLNRDHTIDSRIRAYEKTRIERIFMSNIVNRLLELRVIAQTGIIVNTQKWIKDIEINLYDREIALKKRSICRYLLMLFKFKFIKSRMIESWLVDIFIIVTDKINNKRR